MLRANQSVFTILKVICLPSFTTIGAITPFSIPEGENTKDDFTWGLMIK
jgi:hypothetical protein